jgi:hypothetical protein
MNPAAPSDRPNTNAQPPEPAARQAAYPPDLAALVLTRWHEATVGSSRTLAELMLWSFSARHPICGSEACCRATAHARISWVGVREAMRPPRRLTESPHMASSTLGRVKRGRTGCAYVESRLRGRPPLAPLAFAAAAFALDLLRPPRRPVAAANRRVPKARSTSPGM